MADSALSQTDFEAIVEAGIRAPSADNHHPVRFKREGNAIQFLATPEYVAAPPHRKLLGAIGFGAMAENMRLRARALGWAGDLTVAEDSADPTLRATMNFAPCAPEASDLEAAITERHTNRAFFRGPRLSVATQEEMAATLADLEGVSLHWCDEPKARRQVCHLVRIAETERFRNPAMHAELFGCIRFDVGWHASAEEGLPPATLAIEPPLRAPFAWLRHPAVMKATNVVGGHLGLGLRAGYAPCRLTPNIVVLATTQAHGPESDWTAGRALERFWLKATALELAVQPMAASALFTFDRYTDVPNGLRETLVAGWRALVTDARPTMLFRLGRAQTPTTYAERPSLQHFIA